MKGCFLNDTNTLISWANYMTDHVDKIDKEVNLTSALGEQLQLGK